MAEFDRDYWEERHRSSRFADTRKPPNPHLAGETSELPPGRALDAGCGDGTEAMWLAENGWYVTAVDLSPTALDRARRRAEELPANVSHRIEWRQADLTEWTPSEASFDLVTSNFVHPAGSPSDMYLKLARAVVPGGTLVITGHDSAERHSHVYDTSAPEAFSTPEAIAALFEPSQWTVVTAETRSRTAVHHDHDVTVNDIVVTAHRRR
ncbi:class I SAM-dependent methyltransferase [Haloglycomyces albus]|uniref:class I SAM-dependent methyltransferase n=1 Tax=Haloglycomyces albus TaxID=526067 RepID=UPI00046D5AAD|nr:class I SAM-dependent methyltransferase [Haloglycomyces albus]